MSLSESAAAVAQQANAVRAGSTPLEGGVNTVSGVLRFRTILELKEYVKGLLDVYKKEYERTTEAIGSMYRVLGERVSEGSAMGSWSRVGALYVDSTDVEKGEMEVALQVVVDLKPRLEKTEEIVDGFPQLDDMPAAAESEFLLYLRNGAPERLIVDSRNRREGQVSFSEEYELVP